MENNDGVQSGHRGDSENNEESSRRGAGGKTSNGRGLECKNRRGRGKNNGSRREQSKKTVKRHDINKEGKRLIKVMENRGWTIINGNKGEEGEWYIGEQGATVIVYVIANKEAVEGMKRLKVGQRTESDHQPLELEIWGEEMEEVEHKGSREEMERRDWSRERIGKYLEECENWSSKEEEIKKLWKEIKTK